MTGTTRGNVLKIRCSDGRSRKPDYIRCDWVHEIRMPGGLLFPDLCAHSVYGREQTFALSEPIDLAIQSQINKLCSLITPETGYVIGELVILLAIKTMVDLKKPERIILVYHNHCGAANAIGLDDCAVLAELVSWREKLVGYYPHIRVSILRERHSECGEHHHGHEEVGLAALAEAA